MFYIEEIESKVTCGSYASRRIADEEATRLNILGEGNVWIVKKEPSCVEEYLNATKGK